jgi:hypothetical protein
MRRLPSQSTMLVHVFRQLRWEIHGRLSIRPMKQWTRVSEPLRLDQSGAGTWREPSVFANCYAGTGVLKNARLLANHSAGESPLS